MRRRSRAVETLRTAPTSQCPHCGRVTKTVDGTCVECWGVKDEAAVRLRPDPPRTTRLLDVDWDDPWVLRIGVGLVGILVLAFIKAVS